MKLIDVYPEQEPSRSELRGYQLMIAGEVIRARFRDSFAQPTALVPNQVVRYEVPLRARAHAFLKGHKIMVQIQSSWFPLIDRNPQRYVPSIFAAQEADFAPATQRIFRGSETPSAIILPVFRD